MQNTLFPLLRTAKRVYPLFILKALASPSEVLASRSGHPKKQRYIALNTKAMINITQDILVQTMQIPLSCTDFMLKDFCILRETIPTRFSERVDLH